MLLLFLYKVIDESRKLFFVNVCSFVPNVIYKGGQFSLIQYLPSMFKIKLIEI